MSYFLNFARLYVWVALHVNVLPLKKCILVCYNFLLYNDTNIDYITISFSEVPFKRVPINPSYSCAMFASITN